MSLREMSRTFRRAFCPSTIQNYRSALSLYEKVIQEEPHNFTALNNYGIAKIYVGISDENRFLIQEGVQYLKNAIRVAKDHYKFEDGYPEANLKWAETELIPLLGE